MVSKPDSSINRWLLYQTVQQMSTSSNTGEVLLWDKSCAIRTFSLAKNGELTLGGGRLLAGRYRTVGMSGEDSTVEPEFSCLRYRTHMLLR